MRRALWGALAALCALTAMSSSAHGHAAAFPRGWSPLVFVEADSPFRLGTAAQPFGWSTAVGDLNADGRPDYAEADRIGRSGGGFEYSVQFSVSGLAAQSVTFDSPDAALSISLRDVDHDQDLDVVVSTIVSPTVVRVWLNDGRGVFSETARRDVATEWRAGPSLATDDDGGAAVVALPAPRRGGDTLRTAQHVSTDLVAPSILTARGADRVISASRTPTRSRAPPPAASLLA